MLLVTAEQEFSDLHDAWRRLEQKPENANPFLSFAWNFNWWKTFGSPSHLGRGGIIRWCKRLLYAFLARKRSLFVVARQGGSATGWIAPLARRTYRFCGIPARCLEFLTDSDAGYSGLLVGDDIGQTVSDFVEYLSQRRDEWDLVDLRHFSHDSTAPSLIVEAARRAGLRASAHIDATVPIVSIDSDWNTILRGKSQQTRHLLRKQTRRLQHAGATIRTLEDPSVEPALIQRLAKLESRKVANRMPTLRVLPGSEAFYDVLFRTFGPQQKLYAVLLEISGRLVAYEWGFRTSNCLMGHNKAYDPAFARFSPGTMLLPAIIDFAFENGCREYDFVRGQEDYKYRWATKSMPSWRVEIWAPTLRSRTARFAFRYLRPLALRILSGLRIRYTNPWDI